MGGFLILKAGVGNMFNIINQGLFQRVESPRYGRQDIGISPAGCMDRFAYDVGNILLDNAPGHPALEIIFAPRLAFEKAAWFVLTGACHDPVNLSRDGEITPITHGRVYFAPAGSVLGFGTKVYGFRTYLCWREVVDGPGDQDLNGRDRGAFKDICRWPDPEGMIRVVEGPEYGFVKNPEGFTSQAWQISTDSNHMGLRLVPSRRAVEIEMGNMISAPVSDGSVQLTPKGPIVLLRHRQTIGGYPRIFNVISADVDLLAQYVPGQIIRFKKIDMDRALTVARERFMDLLKLKEQYTRQDRKGMDK